jgi:molybdopterin converting factor small subunit
MTFQGDPVASCFYGNNGCFSTPTFHSPILKRKQLFGAIINVSVGRGECGMLVKVHYISLVKSYTNKMQEEFSLSGDTSLLGLLDKIAGAYGKPFSAEVYDPDKKEMKSTFVAMVNGVLMDQLAGLNTPLKDGDNVILMSLVTGG